MTLLKSSEKDISNFTKINEKLKYGSLLKKLLKILIIQILNF